MNVPLSPLLLHLVEAQMTTFQEPPVTHSEKVETSKAFVECGS
jgi:hypothetical protein